MKTVCKLAAVTLLTLAVSVYGFSQTASAKKPPTATQNLIRGVIGAPGSNGEWSNYSVFNTIPGSGLFPITSSTAVFYFGFTSGSEADIGNMVLYTTPRGSLTISAVTPVTLGGISNPSILLSNVSVCPTQPLSATTPCIVRFDPTTITLSAASDYYLAVYFVTGTNNSDIAGTNPANAQSSLGGNYYGGDDTHLTVGQSVPGAPNRGPVFLMYVMNN